MASPLHDFGRIAQRLSRNPLGIVALFIVLVYGIAGLVLGASSSNLEHSERLPLVWFLVVFTFKFPDKLHFTTESTEVTQRNRI